LTPEIPLKVRARFFRKTRRAKSLPSVKGESFALPCLLWTGATDNKGYGIFRAYEGAMGNASGLVRVHRFAYWIKNGPYLKGMQVDHRCRTKLCLEPAHMQLLSIKEHAKKSNKEKLTVKQLDDILKDIL